MHPCTTDQQPAQTAERVITDQQLVCSVVGALQMLFVAVTIANVARGRHPRAVSLYASTWLLAHSFWLFVLGFTAMNALLLAAFAAGYAYGARILPNGTRHIVRILIAVQVAMLRHGVTTAAASMAP